MRIQHLIHQSFQTTHPHAGIDSIEKRLRDNSFLVVLDEGFFVGILTPSDIIESPHRLVMDCLHDKPRIGFEQDIQSVVALMKESRYSVLPVFKGDGFIGVVTQAAVIDYFEEYHGEMTRAISEHTVELAKANKQLKQEMEERKRAEEQTLLANERLQYLLASTTAVIYTAKTSGYYAATFITDNVAQVVGHEAREFFENPSFWIDHVHPEDKQRVSVEVARVFEEGLSSYEYRFRRKDGTYMWLRDEMKLVRDKAGNPLEIVGYWIDITERKQAQEQLRVYANELERKNQELKQLVYVVSHDLQEPLATLSDYMALFARRYKGRIDSDADEYINRATSLTKKSQRFSHALLKYARTGRLGRQVERTDCEAVLDRALLEFEIPIAKHNAKITRDPLPTIMADGLQLEQLFRNLIGNAIKFRKKEEVPHVHVSAQQHEAEWAFSVQDNGIGIDPEFAAQIFQVFHRIPSNDEYSGEGIGLAVCRKIVEAHGGRIWVESELGKGAVFYFTIPATD